MRRSSLRLFVAGAGSSAGGGWFSTTFSNALLFCNYHLLHPVPAGLATSAAVSTTTTTTAAAAAVSTTSSPWWCACFPDPVTSHAYGVALFQLLSIPPGTSTAAAAVTAAGTSFFYYPFVSLLLCGVLVRLLTIPLTLYGEAALLRLHGARPHLCEAYRQYMIIANHPDAIAWEKRVAAQKLRNDRQRIFRTFRSNNLLAYVPFLAAAGLNAAVLMGPVVGAQVGPFLVQHSLPSLPVGVASGWAGIASALSSQGYCPSPLLLTADTLTSSSSLIVLLDPTWTAAALVSWWNARQHLQLRRGMGAKAEAVRRQGEKVSRRVFLWGGALAGLFALPTWSLLFTTSGGAVATPLLATLPSYIAPAWLGMALTTAVKTALVRRVRAAAYAPVLSRRDPPPSSSSLSATHTTEADAPASDEDVAQRAEEQRERREREQRHGINAANSKPITNNNNNNNNNENSSNNRGAGSSGASKGNSELEEDDQLLDTSQGHPYKLSFTGEDAEERRGMWKIQRKMLEYECDVRLFRLFRRLWTNAEELEEEAEKLRRKASVARERRRQREQGKTTSPLSAPPPRGGAEEEEGTAAATPTASNGGGGGQPSMTTDEARELRMVIEAQEMRNAVFDRKERRRQERARREKEEE